MTEEKRDILEVLEIYRKRLKQFKREMAKIGVKVKVHASLGIWTSVVEGCDVHEGFR